MNGVLEFLVITAILGMIPTAFGGLGYAWIAIRRKAPAVELPVWRRTVFTIGFIAVGAQRILFISSWTRFGRGDLFFQWIRWVLPLFLFALPCVLPGKGAPRWWLLMSTVLLFVVCFFIALSL